MAEKEPYKPGLGKNQGLLQQLKEFQRNPKSLVFVSLAESYRAEGLPHQALDILEEGLAHHPSLSTALLSKARTLFELRRYAEALQETLVVLQSNPQNIKAHKLQAEVYGRLGQRKAAMRALTQVVSLYPQDVEAVRALEELENLGAKQQIPVRSIGRASTDSAPASAPAPKAGRIEDFQVGSFADSLASIGVKSFEEEGGLPMPPPDATPAPARPSPIPASSPPVFVVKAPAPTATVEDPDDGVEPTFATRTIAELYLRQGLKSKAIKVLRKMVREDSANEWARETLQDLESDGIVPSAQPQPQSPPKKPANSLERRAKALELMLARVRLMKDLGA